MTLKQATPHLRSMAAAIDVGARARRRSRVRLAIFLAGLSIGVPSSAQDYALKDVAGWTVSASQDRRGCFLTKTYPGPGATTLLLGLDVDGSNRLSVLNAHWSIKEKDRQSLRFRLSKAAFPKHPVVGIAADGKRGFVTSFGERFPASFAASTFLHIFRGDIPVEQLSLAGSGAAVAELRTCVDMHRVTTRSDGQGRGRAGSIPIDPFAPDAGRMPRK